MLRPVLIALLALAVAPAAAAAAVVEIEVSPKGGADFGETHAVTGRLTGPYGAPLVGRRVVLEARRYPYRGLQFTALGEATTGLDGRFAFDQAFDRNHEVRVLAPEFGDRSAVEPAYVFPLTKLTFKLVRRNTIRIIQTYRTPKDVRLTAPTFFYVGPAGAKTAPRAATARTRRIRRGRFSARALVRIPKAWKGHFRYASCFPYNAGMGDPKVGCPKKRYKF
jgi:hypothetical protein